MKYNWYIANVVAGMYDTSNLGKSLIATQGIKAQKQISFIREHEREADRLAINIMAKANINPNAMSGFFKALLKVMPTLKELSPRQRSMTSLIYYIYHYDVG